MWGCVWRMRNLGHCLPSAGTTEWLLSGGGFRCSPGAEEFCRAAAWALVYSLVEPLSAATVACNGSDAGHKRSSADMTESTFFSTAFMALKSLTGSGWVSFAVSLRCFFGTSLFGSCRVSLISSRFLADSLSNCRKVITARHSTDWMKAARKCCFILCKQLPSYQITVCITDMTSPSYVKLLEAVVANGANPVTCFGVLSLGSFDLKLHLSQLLSTAVLELRHSLQQGWGGGATNAPFLNISHSDKHNLMLYAYVPQGINWIISLFFAHFDWQDLHKFKVIKSISDLSIISMKPHQRLRLSKVAVAWKYIYF